MMACGRNLKCQLKPLKNIFYHEIIELRCCTEWSGYARGNTAIFLVRPYLSNPVIWISSNETFVFAAPHLFISLCLPWAPLLFETKWLAGYFTFCSWAKTAVFPNMCGRNCFMINIQLSNPIQDWPLCVGLSENVKGFPTGSRKIA